MFKYYGNNSVSQDTQPVQYTEFCLPYAELRHVVEGLTLNELDCTLLLQYPVYDNKLQVCLTEIFKPLDSEPLKTTTVLLMSVYNVQHSFDMQGNFRQPGISTVIFGYISHFKNALREFSWLEEDQLEIITSKQYPKLKFRYTNAHSSQNHSLSFNE